MHLYYSKWLRQPDNQRNLLLLFLNQLHHQFTDSHHLHNILHLILQISILKGYEIAEIWLITVGFDSEGDEFDGCGD